MMSTRDRRRHVSSPIFGSFSPTIMPSNSFTQRPRPSQFTWEARRLANLPAGISIGRFRARSLSSWCANFTGKISIRLSHRRPRLIMPSAFHSRISAIAGRCCLSASTPICRRSRQMERCYAFGQAVAHTVTALELKTVILSSGGMSHFPGTDRYSSPELGWDKRLLEKLSAGNLKSPIGYDEDELDNTGIIEFRRADHRSPQNRMWPHRSCSSKPAGSTTTGGFSRPWSSSSPVDALGCLQCPAPCNSMATHPSKGRSAIRVKSPGWPERSQQ